MALWTLNRRGWAALAARRMTPDIGLILGIDGIATGSIYVLVGLGLVLIFSVTRVVFVPFGDIVAFSALTLAAMQLGRTPGTIYLIATLAVIACLVEVVHHAQSGQLRRIPRGLLGYGVLPLIPAAIAWLTAGTALPSFLQIPLAIALVVPIGPLIERIALRPLADASVLLLLIVSVALTFGLSGLGLLFFGAEGFRTKPLTSEIFRFGTVIVSSQTLLMLGSAVVFSLLLFLFFEHTLSGKALRATSINRVGARIVGIRPSGTATLAFLLASLLAAISGILISPVTTLYYDFGLHHRAESLCRRDHRRPPELPGNGDRGSSRRGARKLRVVLEQRAQGSDRVWTAHSRSAVAFAVACAGR